MAGRTRAAFVLAAALLAGCLSAPASADNCADRDGLYLQILGSGGPVADDARASSAYLVWIDGDSKILIDAGGGAFVRFGAAGADFAELDVIALSHFHTDHAADFVTLLKTGYFSPRERPLVVLGPGAGGPFPSLDAWLDSHLGRGEAYAYLGGYLDGSGGLVQLLPTTIDPASRDAEIVFESVDERVSIRGTGVPHGIVPAIAYRVSVAGRDIVFASDQNGSDEAFIDFARGADVLVMHMVVGNNADSGIRALHATPGKIGELAAAIDPGLLVLSHLTAWSLESFDQNIKAVRRHFDGDIVIAEDLLCVSPPARAADRAGPAGSSSPRQ